MRMEVVCMAGCGWAGRVGGALTHGRWVRSKQDKRHLWGSVF